MQLLRSIVVCAVMFAGVQQGLAQDHLLSLETRTYLSLGIDQFDVGQAELVLEPKWESNWTTGFSTTLSGRLRLDPADDLDPGRPDRSGYSAINGVAALGDVGTLELRDAYAEIEAGAVFFRLGKQQIVWGELEGFRLLDVVNPQSFREFILDDFDDSRIGLWTASVEFPIALGKFGNWDAQLIWVPDPTVSEIPVGGATFEFRAPRFLFGAEEPSNFSLGDVRVEAPDSLIGDAAYGGRLVGFVGGWDLSLVAYSGIDPEPVGRVDFVGTDFEIVRAYKRREVFGASAAKSFGRFTGRIETAVQPGRVFTTAEPTGLLAQEAATQFGGALVIDMIAPGDIFVSLQALYDSVIDPPRGLIRPRDDIFTSLYIKRGFRRDALNLSLRWLAADGGADGVISPKLDFAFDDTASLSISADIFYGDRIDVFGQFRNEDRVTLSFKKNF